MKLATNNTRAVHNLASPSHFSIKKENMSHIIGILRSKIYSNKWLAVLREYLTNAVDAHIEAGVKDTPVQLTLPTLSSPTIKIRDFGKGLSEEDIREMYIMYGSSTKRQSNSYTGCLGIGGKAAFAYTDSFGITSYYEGKRSIYTAVIDNEGEGSLYLTGCTATTEPNGIEIIVPSQTNDFENFKDEANRLLPYFDVMPTITNPNLTIPTLEIIRSGERWRIKKGAEGSHRYQRNQGSPTGIMGNIPYKLDSSKMGDGSDIELLNCKHLIINFPLGSLDIAANRESLEYTPRTIQNIKIEAKRVLKDIAEQLQLLLTSSKTLWEASLTALDLIDNLPSSIGSAVFQKMHYQGENLKRDFRFPGNVQRHYRKYRYRAHDHTNAKESTMTIKVEPKATICSYDTFQMRSKDATKRIRTLQANGGWDKDHKFYAVAYNTLEKIPQGTAILNNADIIPKKFLEELPPAYSYEDGTKVEWQSDAHLLKENYVDLHKIEAYKPIRTTKSSDGVNTSVRIDTCHLAPSRLPSGIIIKSEELVPCNGYHVYIPLDRYSWHKKKYCLDKGSFKLIETGTHMLHQATGLPKLVIHGVKKHYLKNLDNTWIELDVWYDKLYKKLKNKYRKLFELAAGHQHGHMGVFGSADHRVFNKLDKNLRFPAWEAFRTIREQFRYSQKIGSPHHIHVPINANVDAADNECVSGLIHDVWLRFNTGYEHPNTIIEAHEKFIKAHPMMKYFTANWRTDKIKELNDVKEYLTRA